MEQVNAWATSEFSISWSEAYKNRTQDARLHFDCEFPGFDELLSEFLQNELFTTLLLNPWHAARSRHTRPCDRTTCRRIHTYMERNIRNTKDKKLPLHNSCICFIVC